LSGVAKYLFTPLALAVVLAMMASYILSRTLVPTMVKYLIRSEVARYRRPERHAETGGARIFRQVHYAFDRWFQLRREGYRNLLEAALGTESWWHCASFSLPWHAWR